MKRRAFVAGMAAVMAAAGVGQAQQDLEGAPRRGVLANGSAGALASLFSPHGLRHTFASLLLQNGETAQYVQEQLGHASLTLTTSTYGR